MGGEFPWGLRDAIGADARRSAAVPPGASRALQVWVWVWVWVWVIGLLGYWVTGCECG